RDTRHLAGDHLADDVFVRHTVPWARQELLQTQADLPPVAIDLQDHYLESLAGLDNRRGIRHARPAHLADVQQAIEAAQINERAEVLHGTNHAASHLSLGDFLPELVAIFVALPFEEGASAHD